MTSFWPGSTETSTTRTMTDEEDDGSISSSSNNVCTPTEEEPDVNVTKNKNIVNEKPTNTKNDGAVTAVAVNSESLLSLPSRRNGNKDKEISFAKLGGEAEDVTPSPAMTTATSAAVMVATTAEEEPDVNVTHHKNETMKNDGAVTITGNPDSLLSLTRRNGEDDKELPFTERQEQEEDVAPSHPILTAAVTAARAAVATAAEAVATSAVAMTTANAATVAVAAAVAVVGTDKEEEEGGEAERKEETSLGNAKCHKDDESITKPITTGTPTTVTTTLNSSSSSSPSSLWQRFDKRKSSAPVRYVAPRILPLNYEEVLNEVLCKLNNKNDNNHRLDRKTNADPKPPPLGSMTTRRKTDRKPIPQDNEPQEGETTEKTRMSVAKPSTPETITTSESSSSSSSSRRSSKRKFQTPCRFSSQDYSYNISSKADDEPFLQDKKKPQAETTETRAISATPETVTMSQSSSSSSSSSRRSSKRMRHVPWRFSSHEYETEWTGEKKTIITSCPPAPRRTTKRQHKQQHEEQDSVPLQSQPTTRRKDCPENDSQKRRRRPEQEPTQTSRPGGKEQIPTTIMVSDKDDSNRHVSFPQPNVLPQRRPTRPPSFLQQDYYLCLNNGRWNLDSDSENDEDNSHKKNKKKKKKKNNDKATKCLGNSTHRNPTKKKKNKAKTSKKPDQDSSPMLAISKSSTRNMTSSSTGAYSSSSSSQATAAPPPPSSFSSPTTTQVTAMESKNTESSNVQPPMEPVTVTIPPSLLSCQVETVPNDSFDKIWPFQERVPQIMHDITENTAKQEPSTERPSCLSPPIETGEEKTKPFDVNATDHVAKSSSICKTTTPPQTEDANHDNTVDHSLSQTRRRSNIVENKYHANPVVLARLPLSTRTARAPTRITLPSSFLSKRMKTTTTPRLTKQAPKPNKNSTKQQQQKGNWNYRITQSMTTEPRLDPSLSLRTKREPDDQKPLHGRKKKEKKNNLGRASTYQFPPLSRTETSRLNSSLMPLVVAAELMDDNSNDSTQPHAPKLVVGNDETFGSKHSYPTAESVVPSSARQYRKCINTLPAFSERKFKDRPPRNLVQAQKGEYSFNFPYFNHFDAQPKGSVIQNDIFTTSYGVPLVQRRVRRKEMSNGSHGGSSSGEKKPNWSKKDWETLCFRDDSSCYGDAGKGPFCVPLRLRGSLRVWTGLIPPQRLCALRKEMRERVRFRQYRIQNVDEPRVHALYHTQATPSRDGIYNKHETCLEGRFVAKNENVRNFMMDAIENSECAQPGYKYAAIYMKSRALEEIPEINHLATDLLSTCEVSDWGIGVNPICYRDGKDRMGLHADDDQGEEKIMTVLVDSPPIARRVLIQTKPSQQLCNSSECSEYLEEQFELFLQPGDAYEMDGLMQTHYVHGVPKDTKQMGQEKQRLVIVFRSGQTRWFKKDSGRPVLHLTPRPQQPSPYVFGPVQGIEYGKEYCRNDLLRTCGHSACQKGISGNSSFGCDAIIVSGKRSDNLGDDCFGYLLYAAEYKVGAACMVFSAQQGESIRVFRRCHKKVQHQKRDPKKQMYRYDGLYEIVAFSEPKILSKERTVLFVLRMRNWDPHTKANIDPTPEQYRATRHAATGSRAAAEGIDSGLNTRNDTHNSRHENTFAQLVTQEAPSVEILESAQASLAQPEAPGTSTNPLPTFKLNLSALHIYDESKRAELPFSFSVVTFQRLLDVY